MPRLSANLSFLFTERPFLERFDAAARCGFRAVEFHFPYEFAQADVLHASREAGVEVVLFNLPAGDWAAGERGIACLPDRVEAFCKGVGLALDWAALLDCPSLNCLLGLTPAGVSAEWVRHTVEDNLKYAAEQCVGKGRRLLVEPLNTRDTPGFYLHRTEQAMELVEALGEGRLGIQYDIYHAQVMEGNLAATLARYLPHIGHVQLADNPGRNEPGTGEINFSFVLRELDRLGYAGWVGCEYVPSTGRAEDSFGWAGLWLQSAPRDLQLS